MPRGWQKKLKGGKSRLGKIVQLGGINLHSQLMNVCMMVFKFHDLHFQAPVSRSTSKKVQHSKLAEQVWLWSSQFISFADISGVTTKVEQRVKRTVPHFQGRLHRACLENIWVTMCTLILSSHRITAPLFIFWNLQGNRWDGRSDGSFWFLVWNFALPSCQPPREIIYKTTFSQFGLVQNCFFSTNTKPQAIATWHWEADSSDYTKFAFTKRICEINLHNAGNIPRVDLIWREGKKAVLKHE